MKQVVRYMWGANCHYGIIMTPTTTFILRDDFTAPGPESIRLTDELSTAKLLSRMSRPMGEAPPRHNWNGWRASGSSAWRHLTKRHCPTIAEVVRALFPEIVGAVAEGRVVDEVAAR